MATAGNGTIVPAGTTVFDLVQIVNDLNSSLHGRLNILAANATARTALTSTCGWAPTAADPLVVLQTDTMALWLYNGTSWAAIVGGPKNYSSRPAETAVATGVTLTTLVIPAQAVACRVHVSAIGEIGFVGASPVDMGLTVTSSGGTLTSVLSATPVTADIVGKWYGYYYYGHVDLTAGAGTTITFASLISSGPAYYRLWYQGQILFAGEYA